MYSILVAASLLVLVMYECSAIHIKSYDKRRITCKFPKNENLTAVTPDELNGGWAISPDRSCHADSWCPYACPPGQLMAQWDPEVTTYTYPESQYGGLYCNSDGELEIPFPDRPFCVDGVGTLEVSNRLEDVVAFCQTVLPGNEAMLIPTSVEGHSPNTTLAVPDDSYWAETASHYFVNPPGYNATDACVWGTRKTPIGNWSPYIAGGNMDKYGTTFMMVGWNPIYIEPETPFRDEMPDFGISITCDDPSKCFGGPCLIDPLNPSAKTGRGAQPMAIGAGGAEFCVMAAVDGAVATINVFQAGASLSDNALYKRHSDYPKGREALDAILYNSTIARDTYTLLDNLQDTAKTQNETVI